MARPDPHQLHRESFRDALSSLAIRCCERFVRAADLVQMRGPVILKLRVLARFEPVDVSPLSLAWLRICERFLEERYDAQLALLEENKSEHCAVKFGEFIYWELFPILEGENELVRNVLRAIGGLPCKSKQDAANAVLHYFDEMTLPNGQPRWASEEQPE